MHVNHCQQRPLRTFHIWKTSTEETMSFNGAFIRRSTIVQRCFLFLTASPPRLHSTVPVFKNGWYSNGQPRQIHRHVTFARRATELRMKPRAYEVHTFPEGHWGFSSWGLCQWRSFFGLCGVTSGIFSMEALGVLSLTRNCVVRLFPHQAERVIQESGQYWKW
ncbi:hypothetical protein Tcan_00153 [Toxocara canis]|uniref:Uncharacterized protein n=1 Tax=Toxocara canis TaxID=6265 RepID=A0A0B2V642_TOXCA|nr:hypothetical protein Tcan_00153 [Toxocara canis]